MSVSNATVKQLFAGNGSNVNFAIPFAFISGDLTPIKVYLVDDEGAKTLKTIVTHYTLSPSGANPTTVVFGTAPTADERVLLVRELPYTQTADYTNKGDFENEDHELALDRIVLQIQQANSKASRAMKSSILESTDLELELPEVDGNAGKSIHLNDAETGLEFGLTVAELEAIRDDAEAAAAAALASEGAASASATAASNSATAAETAETNAEAAAAAAAASASDANDAKNAAEAAQTAAELAETNAETAETNAEAAAAAAAASETAAELAETNAETAETNAELAETNAEAAQAAAEAAQAAAELAETNAETAETNAETAEAAAEAAQAAAEAAAAAGIPDIVGTIGAPVDVVQATGIVFTETNYENVHFLQGSGGAVDLSALPAQIQAGTVPGQKLTIIGAHATKSIRMVDGNGISLPGGGEIYILLGVAVEFVWTGSVWARMGL